MTIWNTSKPSAAVMIVMFAATLFVPLQYGFFLGVVLAPCLMCCARRTRSPSSSGCRSPKGSRWNSRRPGSCPATGSTLLHVYGSLFFAAAKNLEELLPAVDNTTHAVVAISMRGAGEIGEYVRDRVGALCQGPPRGRQPVDVGRRGRGDARLARQGQGCSGSSARRTSSWPRRNWAPPWQPGHCGGLRLARRPACARCAASAHPSATVVPT